MTTDNEKFNENEPMQERSKNRTPWNTKFGPDENLKQRQYTRASRNQSSKEASPLSKVLLGLIILTVIIPFVLFFFVKQNAPTNEVKPQSASSIMLARSSETTTQEAEETTTNGTLVQGEVSSVDINATTEAEVTTVVTEAPTQEEVVTEAPAPAQRTHVIAQGETWYGIARAYGVDVNALAAANGTTTASTLYPGNTLIIP